MKANSLETILGAIVLIVAIVFLIYSARTGDVQEVKGYTVYARFNQIGGLLPGDAVRISGVKIGSVREITLTKDTYLANVNMTIDSAAKIPVDSAATVASTGLLGGNYVEISPGGDELMFADQGLFEYTQDAQNLERLLGQFIFSVSDAKSDDAPPAAAPEPTAFVEPKPAPAAVPAPVAEPVVAEPVAEEVPAEEPAAESGETAPEAEPATDAETVTP